MQQQPEIKTVTEPDRFGQIIKDYYETGQLFIKLSGNNIAAEFVKTAENNIMFLSVPNAKNLPKECLIAAKFNNELVYGTMKQIEQKKDIFKFTPLKFQIIKLLRREQRIGINDDSGKRIIFISSIVSQINLESDIVTEKKKTDQIKNRIAVELGEIFNKIKIFIIGEKQADNRFRYLMNNPKIIYIPDINTPDEAPDKEQFKFYAENIYTSDYNLKNGGLVSEITAPLLYKKQMPYGYIQINSVQALTGQVPAQIKTYASYIGQVFEKSDIFTSSSERFIVIDVSQNGFAIAFKDKKFLRLFHLNVYMCVQMLLTDKDIDMYVIVKRITPDSRMITVGFQILAIEERGAYENFIKSISPKNEG